MRRLIPILILAAGVTLARAQVPLYNSYLAADMAGRGYSITNLTDITTTNNFSFTNIAALATAAHAWGDHADSGYLPTNAPSATITNLYVSSLYGIPGSDITLEDDIVSGGAVIDIYGFLPRFEFAPSAYAPGDVDIGATDRSFGNLYLSGGKDIYIDGVGQSNFIATAHGWGDHGAAGYTTGAAVTSIVAAADGTPYTITAVDGTATVSRANGWLQSVVATGAMTIVVSDGATNAVSQVNLSLWASTNSITWATNNVTYDAVITPATNAATTVLYFSPLWQTTWEASEL